MKGMLARMIILVGIGMADSVYQKDGMYLGRCFLEVDHQVGLVWAEFKKHPRLFCSVQDDDFVARFR
jgi:hypothetical protein